MKTNNALMIYDILLMHARALYSFDDSLDYKDERDGHLDRIEAAAELCKSGRVRRDAYNPFKFEVQSTRSFRTWYDVILGDPNSCDCPDFSLRFMPSCKHIQAAMMEYGVIEGIWLFETGIVEHKPAEPPRAKKDKNWHRAHMRALPTTPQHSVPEPVGEVILDIDENMLWGEK